MANPLSPYLPEIPEAIALQKATAALNDARIKQITAVLQAGKLTDPAEAQSLLDTADKNVKKAEDDLIKAQAAYLRAIDTTTSRWVSYNFGDIGGMSGALRDIGNTLADINGGIQTLVDITNAIIAIVDIASELVALVEDLNATAIKGALEILKVLKEELIEFLNKIFNFGVYVLPHIEAFDITTVIKNELLSPGFESKSAGPQEGYTRVPNRDNPKEYHYEKVIRASRGTDLGYNAFIQDILKSLDDQLDTLRPQFPNETKITGLTMAIASNRLALFVVLYILITMLMNSKEDSIAKMKPLAAFIRRTLALSETVARSENSSTRDELVAVLEQMDSTIGAKELGEDFATIIKRFLDIFPRKNKKNEDVSGPPELNIVNFNGPSPNYMVIQDAAEKQYGQDKLPQLTSNVTLTINSNEQPNKTSEIATGWNLTNNVRASVSTNGKGALYMVYQYGGNTYKAYVGSGETSYDVTIPLLGSFAANGDNSTVSYSWFDAKLQVDYGNWNVNWKWGTDNNWNTAIPPVKASFILKEVPSGVEPQSIDPLENVTENDKVLTVFLPKVDLTDKYGRPLGDGFRHTLNISLEPTTSAQKNKIAKYKGVSEDQVDSMFPMLLFPKSDLSELGPDLDTIDITVVARPQTVLNKSYKSKLIVNGKEYTSTDVTFTPSTVRTVFTDIDINNAENLFMQYIAQQNSTFNIDGTETEYTIYSDIETLNVKLAGGLRGAPTITSGDKANASPNTIITKIENWDNPWNQAYGQQNGSQGKAITGSKVEETDTKQAIYTIKGTKGADSVVYLVIKKGQKTTMKYIGGYNLSGTGSNVFDSTKYQGDILLPWDGKDTEYEIFAYQTTDQNVASRIAAYPSGDDQEATFLAKTGAHHSKAAKKKVTVTNKSSLLEAPLPNWYNVSLSAFFPIVPQVEERLDELLEILEDSIPTAPYDGIQDWLELIKAKIQKIVAIFEKIQAILENINSILQIGNDGLYFLGIAGANGNEGFKQRLQNVPDSPVKNAKYVTGFQIIAPEQFEFLIGNLPSKGQDNVKVKKDEKAIDRVTTEAKNLGRHLDSKGNVIKKSSRKYNTKFDGAVTEPLKKPDFKRRKEFDNG